MRNIFFKSLVLVAALLAIGFWSSAADAISLKKTSVITDTSIKLGDIFADLPHNADKVLGPAPQPGKDMILNARTLMRIALTLDLPWRPSSSGDFVVLKRAATLIERETIESRIKEEMADKGMSGNFNLIIPNEMAQIILPQDQPPTLDVTDLNIDIRTRRFSATLTAPSKEIPLVRTPISGSFERMAAIPVLRESLTSGMIIGQRDLEFIDVPEHKIKHDMIIEASALMGMTPRRVLIPGQPIKAQEIEAPRAVNRGETVTMVFKNGTLLLTMQGKALENGAKGDLVRVVNVNSSKTIEGIVTRENEVTVQQAF